MMTRRSRFRDQDRGMELPLRLGHLLAPKMFQVMDRAGHGLLAITAMSLTTLSLVGYAFLDDADLVDGAIDVDTPREDIIDRF